MTALVLAAGVGAQAIVLPATLPDVGAMARAALDSADPMTRGEAALWLALEGREDAYRPILAVARDAAPLARIRGILAVGLLAAPGAEAFLSGVLDDSATSAPDAVVAAFGLGLLPATVPTPSVDAWLGGVHGGNYKRMRDPLAALLAGLATRPHPEKVMAMHILRTDAANREELLVALAGRALAAAGEPSDPADAWRDLGHRSSLLRAEALRTLSGSAPFDRESLEILRRVTRSDPDAQVRAGALRVLAAAFDDSALDLAHRALASAHPDEAVAGAQVLLRLAGDVGREAVDVRIATPTVPALVRAALLSEWSQDLTPRLTFACRDAARSSAMPMELRVAAAAALARSNAREGGELLASLFDKATARPHLRRLCAAMSAPQLDSVQRALAAPTAPGDPLFGARLHALAGASFDRAATVALGHARARRLDDRQYGLALTALRAARGPDLPADLRAILPEALTALLY